MKNDSKPAIYDSPSVRRALNGEASINAIEAFKQAHELTKTSFSVMAAASVIVFAVGAFVLFASLQFFNLSIEEYVASASPQKAITDIVLLLIISPLMAGLLMMGINRARGQKPEVLDVFKWVKIAIVLALGSLIASILMQIGLSLYFIPGLYVAIATTFTLTLIADKNLTALSAIMLSVRVVNRYLGQFILFFFISFALFIVIAFTMFIAGIWLLPLYFNAKGILYNELFADDEADQQNTMNDVQGSTFNA